MTRGSPIHTTHHSLVGPGKQPAVFLPPFEIDATSKDDLYAIRIEGELDLSGCPSLDRALQEAEASLATRILLDLDELVFIDAAGLNVVVAAWRRSVANGRRLQITRGGGSVARMLHLTALDTVLPFVLQIPGSARVSGP
ncbi:MAG TPA: STAS domain-containing protein [Gemmatimonadales bacterium]|nr:STAS domain-containing protein [Gemmatimonadales bacterium]